MCRERGQARKSSQQQGNFGADQAGRTKPGLPTGAGVRTGEYPQQLTWCLPAIPKLENLVE